MVININSKDFQIHRIIAYVYIYNNDINNKTVVNHINEEKYDNRIENLEWCSSSENTQHSSKSTRIQCTYNNETLTFESYTEVINWIRNNIREKASETPIRQSCRSEFKTAYNIKFWYL